jgi:hypothetical protein
VNHVARTGKEVFNIEMGGEFEGNLGVEVSGSLKRIFKKQDGGMDWIDLAQDST